MSALSKIANATPTGGGNYINDGRYLYFVEKLSYIKGYKGESFIAELRVIEAAASNAVDEQGRPIAPNSVGSTCSMVCNLNQSAAGGNAKAFLIALLAPLGYVEADITEERILEVSDPNANPMRGAAIRNSTYSGINQGRDNPANRGKRITKNAWTAVAQTAEDIKAQRSWLDANATPISPSVAVPAAAAQPIAPAAPAPVQPTPAAVPAPSGPSPLLARLGVK